jgi:AAA15 family ATPase/GTPase
LNVEVNETYSQNLRTWRWDGTKWQEKVTEEFQYFDPNTSSIIRIPGSALARPITNYEYESKLNEDKRKLLIIKPEYLSVIITDLRNIMTYDADDPNYINDKLKKTYNERIMRI